MRSALEIILALVLLASLAAKAWLAPETGHFAERRQDFGVLAKALESYHHDHGSYPKSVGWDGLATPWGQAGPDWIPGLVPAYIGHLPRDPRNEETASRQYLFRSDGKDFKLIAHHVEDCEKARGDSLVRVDPARDCFAYGIWTGNAASW